SPSLVLVDQLIRDLCLVSVFIVLLAPAFVCFFFFIDTATTEIYTLSLHDALPIFSAVASSPPSSNAATWGEKYRPMRSIRRCSRSEEHTSELQSRRDLVCRLLLEKKKTKGAETTKTTPRSEKQSRKT